MIELQTGKANEILGDFNKYTKGIVHFCLYTENLDMVYNRLKTLGFKNFKKKGGEDIYTVFESRLMKIIAPEGTIIEIRDSEIL